MKHLPSLLALVSFLTGCATITKGTTQIVAIDTPGVPGASCTLSSPSAGSQTITTPGSLSLPKSSGNVSIVCSKPCYNEATGELQASIDTRTAGNIGAGGVIGLGVDAASGAMYQYAQRAEILLTPDGSCVARTTTRKRR